MNLSPPIREIYVPRETLRRQISDYVVFVPRDLDVTIQRRNTDQAPRRPSRENSKRNIQATAKPFKQVRSLDELPTPPRQPRRSASNPEVRRLLLKVTETQLRRSHTSSDRFSTSCSPCDSAPSTPTHNHFHASVDLSVN